MSHQDPASASREITVTCPDGESLYPRTAKAESPRIGFRIRRKDGAEREYKDADGATMRLAKGEVVTVDSVGCHQDGETSGIKIRNASGQVTKLLCPVTSWMYEDGGQVTKASKEHSANCPVCKTPSGPVLNSLVTCTRCDAQFLAPAPAGGRRWLPVVLDPHPSGVSVFDLKRVIEEWKGIPATVQELYRPAHPPGVPKTSLLANEDKLQPGENLMLRVTSTPREMLEHYLTRRDTQGLSLAEDRQDFAPWDDPSGRFALDYPAGSTDWRQCVLGRGSFGVVARCRRPDGSKCAVKQVSKETCARSFGEMRRGLVEICTSQFLARHAHLVHFDTILHDAGQIYYVMPLFQGKGLDSVLRSDDADKLQNPRVTKRVTCQLLSALNHLHQYDIAHRDVKPENIICNPQNFDITLIDLGLARYYGTPSVVTAGIVGLPRPGDISGDASSQPVHRALAYVTPGQFTPAYADHASLMCLLNQGQAQKVKPVLAKMDIHGAGATIFACVTKKIAFYREREGGLPPREILMRMAQRSAEGIEQERGFGDFKRLMGEPAAALLKALMDPTPERRCTADQALRHPWLKDEVRSAVRDPPRAPSPAAVRPAQGVPAGAAKELRPTLIRVAAAQEWRRPAEDEDVAEDLPGRERGEMLAVLPRARPGGR